MPLVDRAKLQNEDRTAIEAEVGRLDTLAEVVLWGSRRSPPRLVRAVVAQDEYTHDVVVPWDERLHLVFDTT